MPCNFFYVEIARWRVGQEPHFEIFSLPASLTFPELYRVSSFSGVLDCDSLSEGGGEIW